MTTLDRCFNIADMREAALKRLPKGIFEFIDRGAEDDDAMRNNREGFRKIRLRPHSMVDVSKRSTATELFGKKLGMPLAIAPTGAAGLVCYQGEVALAQAAAAANVPFTLATRSMSAIKDLSAAGGTLWFQLYMWREREKTYELVERVKAAGIDALIVTIDVPVHGLREFNLRNGFTLPFRLSARSMGDMLRHPQWLTNVIGSYYLKDGGMPDYESHPGITDNVTFDDIRELRKRWPRTLMVKGILRPADAAHAVECGADAVIVSNHGGRGLDTAIATIDALPGIIDAVGDRATVLMDSGIRRGSDIVKALSLGAKAVLSGRPCLYGLAVGGKAGAAQVLDMLHHELLTTMGQIGCPTIDKLGPQVLYRGQ